MSSIPIREMADDGASFTSRDTTVVPDYQSQISVASTATLRPPVTDPLLQQLSALGLDATQFDAQAPWVKAELTRLLSFQESEAKLDETRNDLRELANGPGFAFDNLPVQKEQIFAYMSRFPPDDVVESLVMHAHEVDFSIPVSNEIRSILRSRFVECWRHSDQVDGESPPAPSRDDMQCKEIRRLRRAISQTSLDLHDLEHALSASTLGLLSGWQSCRSRFLGSEQQILSTSHRQMNGQWQLYQNADELVQALNAKAKATHLWDTVYQRRSLMHDVKEEDFGKFEEQMNRLRLHDGFFNSYPYEREWRRAKLDLYKVHSWMTQRWVQAESRATSHLQALTGYHYQQAKRGPITIGGGLRRVTSKECSVTGELIPT